MLNLPLANVIEDALSPLINIFHPILLFFHDSFGFSWGLSIIALTVLVRAIMLPLSYKQYKSMQAMKDVAPQMKALQAKYKGDRERLNQEMMKFYRENNVNPFASCLPLVLQIPVFIALFYMLQGDLRTDICGQDKVPCGQIPGSTGQEFLFIPDLTAAATGWVLVVLLVLYVGSQLTSSLLLSVATDKRQKYLFALLPIAFVPFIINFPAGLMVYWITTNVWTLGQQLTIRRMVGKSEAAKAEAGIPGAKAGAAALVAADDKKGRKSKSEPAAETSKNNGPPPKPPRQRRKRSGRRR